MYTAIVILVIVALIALCTGVNVAFGHIGSWARWTPWYGRVEVPS